MSFPYLHTNNAEIDKAYRLALSTLLCNTVYSVDKQSGKECPMLCAGMFYNAPWVRDTSINLWNGAGLLCPEIMRNTLLSLIISTKNGNMIGELVGQSWDVIIWVIGAWYQYLYTGDKEFLQTAFKITENTIAFYENSEFDDQVQLFRGPACYGDGVAAYPDIYAQPMVSAILAFATEKKELCVNKGLGIPMFTLSTNCLYYYAYILADKMAQELNMEAKYQRKAAALRTAINQVFWSNEKGNYTYIYDRFGSCDFDETLGVSFAILFGIADENQSKRIFNNHHVMPYGVPCLWPTFDRYKKSDMDFGRHSGTVWPFIQGFWADAAARYGRQDLFDSELRNQTENALRSHQFAEIYHPLTGEVYGGLQEDYGEIREWDSMPIQTWSATAYIRNIHMNVLGMNFSPDGITFAPCGTSLINEAELTGLKYQNCTLHIHRKGGGKHIEAFLLNGVKTLPFIPSDTLGENTIEIITP